MYFLGDEIDSLELSCECIENYIKEIDEIKGATIREKKDFLKRIPRIETDIRGHKKETRFVTRKFQELKQIINNPENEGTVLDTLCVADYLSKTITRKIKEIKKYFCENKITLSELTEAQAAQIKF